MFQTATRCPSMLDRPGIGTIELTQVAGRTAVTRCRANSPLRLLTPRDELPAARIIAGSYGGGLVGGDAIELTVHAGVGTSCLLATQASTKVYRSSGAGCSQKLKVSAADGAIVASLPDPVVCFAGSRFAQRQQFDLAAGASLLMVDWFTSGRAARGERWAMNHYASRNEIMVEGHCVFRDVLELDPADGAIGGAMRMGRIDCFATVVMVGPALAQSATELADKLQRLPVVAGSSLVFGASSLPGVTVLRVAGNGSQMVGAWLREQLGFLRMVLGMDPWNRKW